MMSKLNSASNDVETSKAIQIDADVSLRKGSYANVVRVQSSPKETVLDFFFVDGLIENGSSTGVLASRVILTRDTVIELNDLLSRHIESDFGSMETIDGKQQH